MASSTAMGKFKERLQEVQLLLEMCSPPEADITVQSAAAAKDNAILRGALVLLCSHVEGFFEDLVGDAIVAYAKLASSCNEIPKAIVAHQVVGRPERWDNCDIVKRLEIVMECTGHPFVSGDKLRLLANLDPDLHTKGFANPGSDEIEGLFKTIGVQRIWERFADIEPDKFIKNALNGLVHRRNQIAHGQMDSTVTRADVENYMAKVQRLGEVMDQVIEKEVCTHLSVDAAWALVQEAGLQEIAGEEGVRVGPPVSG